MKSHTSVICVPRLIQYIVNLRKMARDIRNKEELYRLAEQSSRITINIVENDLKQFPSLTRVIIMEGLPRVDSDSMSAMSDYSDFVLRELTTMSELRDKIVVGSHLLLECDTDVKVTNVFGPSFSTDSSVRYPGERALYR